MELSWRSAKEKGTPAMFSTQNHAFGLFRLPGRGIPECVTGNQTINREYYQSILCKLWYHISRKRPHLCDNWILHRDNAPLHTSASTSKFIEDKFLIVLPHPLYLPDLTPCNFWLSPLLKNTLRGNGSPQRKKFVAQSRIFSRPSP